MGAILPRLDNHAGGVRAFLNRRAPGQSEQAVSGNRGNVTLAIAAAAGISALILLLLVIWRVNRIRKARQAARHVAAHPEMAQAALLAPTTTTTSGTRPANGASRPRRPRRQPSTQTVPEYSEAAGDEEMVLDKAEQEEMQLEHAPADPITVSLLSSTTTRSSEGDQSEAHYAATAAHASPRRASYALSRSTLHDIENPAPELRLDRIDTIQTTNPPSIISSSENCHQPLMAGTNDSVVTLDEVPLDGLPVRQSSFFGSPAYVNRSRSRSIDIVRTMNTSNGQTGSLLANRPLSSGSTLDVPQPRRQSGFMSIFPRRQSATPSNVLPLHQPLTETRREALRNREISAPIGETLVRTSYTYPRAGINPIQAAWLGSRDHITRLATYLDTAPPAFEEDDSLEMNRRTSRDTVSTNVVANTSSTNNDEMDSRPTAVNVLSQLEEESAHLSSLVHQESLRRASLPPHMVALPPSLPVSPTSPRIYGGGNADWPISRATSLARAHSLARNSITSTPRSAIERQSSIARQRVQSEAQASQPFDGSPVSILPRSQSPSPLPRAQAANEQAENARPVLSLSTSTTAGSLHATT